MEADLRGEIVIVEKKWPASLFAAAKGCESVRRHAKCNVSRIIEKPVRATLLIDSNIFCAELSIVFAIHDIHNLAGFMMKVRSIT
jgi:hypothetical protein